MLISLDYPCNMNYGFQESAVIDVFNWIDLYNVYLWFGILVLTLVIVVLGLLCMSNKGSIWLYIKLEKDNIIEIVYTILPCILLVILFIPSMSLIYMVDWVTYINTYINIIGYQWYWNYNILEYSNIEMNITTYNIADNNIVLENYLELDNIICLPLGTRIKCLFTGSDVIHSFGVISLGLKVDCLPGRINSADIEVYRAGLYTGYCSELCGSYHNNMNIVIYIVDYKYYILYLLLGS